MKAECIEWSDCTEVGRCLRAGPGMLVCALPVLAGLVVVAAGAFAALARIDVTVRARGVVRPTEEPTVVVNVISQRAFSAGAGGRVVEVLCREGDRVEQGAPLLRFDVQALEKQTARARRAIAALEEGLAALQRLESSSEDRFRASRGRSEAELRQIEEELQLAQQRQAAEIRSTQLALELAEEKERHIRKLAGQQAASLSELSEATTAANMAREQLTRARVPAGRERLTVLQKELEVIEMDRAQARGDIAAQRAARRAELELARLELAELELDLQHVVVLAPVAGVATEVRVAPGRIVAPGEPLLTLAEEGGFRFDLDVPDDDVVRLRVGMPARIRLDAYDSLRHRHCAGRVEFVAPDALADQPSCYRVRLRINAEEVGEKQLLRPGLAGEALVTVGRDSILGLLLGKLRSW